MTQLDGESQREVVPARESDILPHILVVEDEPVIASLLADVFSRFGYRVTQCHRVDEAIAAATAIDDFALCISDFLLPDRTGLDLVRILRKIRPLLRIVLISAYLEPDLVGRIQKEPGIALVVRKPLDIFELKDRVDALLGRGAAREAGAPPSAPDGRRTSGGLNTWEASC